MRLEVVGSTLSSAGSNFYSRYPRRPDLNHLVAPYVAAQGYECERGVGEVGWYGDAVDSATGQPIGEPLPAWRLGPSSAVAFEMVQRQTQPQRRKHASRRQVQLKLAGPTSGRALSCGDAFQSGAAARTAAARIVPANARPRGSRD